MTCVRFVSMRAEEGKESEVHSILDDVGAYQMGLEGWILGRFCPHVFPKRKDSIAILMVSRIQVI